MRSFTQCGFHPDLLVFYLLMTCQGPVVRRFLAKGAFPIQICHPSSRDHVADGTRLYKAELAGCHLGTFAAAFYLLRFTRYVRADSGCRWQSPSFLLRACVPSIILCKCGCASWRASCYAAVCPKASSWENGHSNSRSVCVTFTRRSCKFRCPLLRRGCCMNSILVLAAYTWRLVHERTGEHSVVRVSWRAQSLSITCK